MPIQTQTSSWSITPTASPRANTTGEIFGGMDLSAQQVSGGIDTPGVQAGVAVGAIAVALGVGAAIGMSMKAKKAKKLKKKRVDEPELPVDQQVQRVHAAKRTMSIDNPLVVNEAKGSIQQENPLVRNSVQLQGATVVRQQPVISPLRTAHLEIYNHNPQRQSVNITRTAIQSVRTPGKLAKGPISQAAANVQYERTQFQQQQVRKQTPIRSSQTGVVKKKAEFETIRAMK